MITNIESHLILIFKFVSRNCEMLLTLKNVLNISNSEIKYYSLMFYSTNSWINKNNWPPKPKCSLPHCIIKCDLKEYYEIVDEASPLYQDFFPHMLIFLWKCISNHEAISKLQSFRAIRALIASQSTFEI